MDVATEQRSDRVPFRRTRRIIQGRMLLFEEQLDCEEGIDVLGLICEDKQSHSDKENVDDEIGARYRAIEEELRKKKAKEPPPRPAWDITTDVAPPINLENLTLMSQSSVDTTAMEHSSTSSMNANCNDSQITDAGNDVFSEADTVDGSQVEPAVSAADVSMPLHCSAEPEVMGANYVFENSESGDDLLVGGLAEQQESICKVVSGGDGDDGAAALCDEDECEPMEVDGESFYARRRSVALAKGGGAQGDVAQAVEANIRRRSVVIGPAAVIGGGFRPDDGGLLNRTFTMEPADDSDAKPNENSERKDGTYTIDDGSTKDQTASEESRPAQPTESKNDGASGGDEMAEVHGGADGCVDEGADRLVDNATHPLMEHSLLKAFDQATQVIPALLKESFDASSIRKESSSAEEKTNESASDTLDAIAVGDDTTMKEERGEDARRTPPMTSRPNSAERAAHRYAQDTFASMRRRLLQQRVTSTPLNSPLTTRNERLKPCERFFCTKEAQSQTGTSLVASPGRQLGVARRSVAQSQTGASLLTSPARRFGVIQTSVALSQIAMYLSPATTPARARPSASPMPTALVVPPVAAKRTPSTALSGPRKSTPVRDVAASAGGHLSTPVRRTPSKTASGASDAVHPRTPRPSARTEAAFASMVAASPVLSTARPAYASLHTPLSCGDLTQICFTDVAVSGPVCRRERSVRPLGGPIKFQLVDEGNDVPRSSLARPVMAPEISEAPPAADNQNDSVDAANDGREGAAVVISVDENARKDAEEVVVVEDSDKQMGEAGDADAGGDHQVEAGEDDNEGNADAGDHQVEVGEDDNECDGDLAPEGGVDVAEGDDAVDDEQLAGLERDASRLSVDSSSRESDSGCLIRILSSDDEAGEEEDGLDDALPDGDLDEPTGDGDASRSPAQVNPRRRFFVLDNSTMTVSTPGVEERRFGATRMDVSMARSEASASSGDARESLATAASSSDRPVHIVAARPPKQKHKNEPAAVLPKRRIAHPDADETANPQGLRRSQRNRVPTLRHWMGEHPVYRNDGEGNLELVDVTPAQISDPFFAKYRAPSLEVALDRHREAQKRAACAHRNLQLIKKKHAKKYGRSYRSRKDSDDDSEAAGSSSDSHEEHPE